MRPTISFSPHGHSKTRGRPLDDFIQFWKLSRPEVPEILRYPRRRVRSWKREVGLILLATLIISSLPVVVHAMDPFGCGLLPPAAKTATKSVALIDSLTEEFPNPGFVEAIASMSKNAGYSFEYYPPEKSTIETFIHLAEKTYSIIVFRTHGTQNMPVLVTYDRYSQDQRVWDQLNGRLQPVEVGGKEVFGVTGLFVSSTMCGRFPGTIVLASGCVTMAGDLGGSFVGKGAKAFIGWKGMVTLDHTDIVFQELMGLLLTGLSPGDAVDRVNGNDGTDLSTGATLGIVSK